MTPALKSSPLGSYDANPRHLAWAAGLFDGDGCVHISKQTQPGRKHPTYRLCLSLVQNCVSTAQRFQEILGLQSHLTAMPRTSKQNRVVQTHQQASQTGISGGLRERSGPRYKAKSLADQ